MTRAVLASARRNTCSVYMYEVTLPGGIGPDPYHAQKYVDISDTIDAKMASLACYDTQVEAYGPSWLDAIRGRAAYRGFQMGRAFAEAFSVVKDITIIPDLR
jgi:LmbE family N-acetylglucosaminyl deacetylase